MLNPGEILESNPLLCTSSHVKCLKRCGAVGTCDSTASTLGQVPKVSPVWFNGENKGNRESLTFPPYMPSAHHCRLLPWRHSEDWAQLIAAVTDAEPPPTESAAAVGSGRAGTRAGTPQLGFLCPLQHRECMIPTRTLLSSSHRAESLCMGGGGKHQRGQNCNQRIWDLSEPWEPLAWPRICWCSLHETVTEQISSLPQPHLMNSELYSISLQPITPLLLRGMRWNYRYSLTPILLLVWDKMIHVLIKGFEMMVCVSEVPVQSELFLKDYIKA